MVQTRRKLAKRIKQRGKANGWTTWTEWILGWMIEQGTPTVHTEEAHQEEWVRDLWRDKVGREEG